MKSLREADYVHELTNRLRRLRPDAPRLWGKMNVRQMICHVNDAFLGIMGEIAMEVPRGFSVWPVIKYIALYAPMQWPHGITTRPEFDQCAGNGTPPAEFASDVRKLIESMERFSRRPRDFDFRPHPMFKEMSEGQWMRWGYLHVDHHLRQFGE